MLERSPTENDDKQKLVANNHLNSDLTTIQASVAVMVENRNNAWLLSLRPRALEIIKREIIYYSNTVREVTARNNPFIYNLKEFYVNKMDVNDILDSDWDNLIHYLKIFSPKKQTNSFDSEKDYKFACLIRHEFDLLYKEHTPFKDTLNELIEEMNKSEPFDYEKLHELLLSLAYHNIEALTPAYIQQYEPAIKHLKERNFLSKVNFLRLILCVNPASYYIKSCGASDLYSGHENSFFLLQPEKCETVLAFIANMNRLNLLNQKNLECLFKVIQLKPQRRNVNKFEDVLKSFLFTAEVKKIDHHKDFFEAFLNEWHRNSCALKDNEREVAAMTDLNPEETVLEFTIQQHLDKIQQKLSASLALTAEDKNETEVVQYFGHALTKQQDVDSIFQYKAAIAKMSLCMLQDKIHSDFNLTLLVQVPDKVESIHAAYVLLRESKTFENPQQAFDTLIETVKYAEFIAPMILWLPLELRTEEKIQLILHNAAYLEDLLAVCIFEFDVFGFHKDSMNRANVTEILFMKNISVKMEYLADLHKIYAFVTRYKLRNPSLYYLALELRLQFVPAIAAGLADGAREEMTGDDASRLFGDVENSASAAAVEYNTKWLETLRAMNLCEVVLNNSPSSTKVEPSLVSGNAGYIVEQRAIYYVNKLRNEFVKIPLTAEAAISLHAVINKNYDRYLSPDKIDKIVKIINHPHFNIPEAIFKRFKYVFVKDMMRVLQGYIFLYAGNLLTEKWERALQDYPEYAVTLAKALVKLNHNHLLRDKYTDLLLLRPESALSIATVLTGFDNSGSLTDENFLILKTNLRFAENMAKQFEPSFNEAAARVLDESQRLMLTSGASEQQLVLRTHVSATNVSEAEPEAGSKHAVIEQEVKQQAVERQAAPLQDEFLFVNEVIKRCRDDYNRNKLFSRTGFLNKVVNRTPSVDEVHLYASENPRSRTAKFYLQVKVENLPQNDLKRFMQSYLNDYEFKFYQRSKLVEKFFAGTINCLADVEKHASADPSSRTSKLLAKIR